MFNVNNNKIYYIFILYIMYSVNGNYYIKNIKETFNEVPDVEMQTNTGNTITKDDIKSFITGMKPATLADLSDLAKKNYIDEQLGFHTLKTEIPSLINLDNYVKMSEMETQLNILLDDYTTKEYTNTELNKKGDKPVLDSLDRVFNKNEQGTVNRITIPELCIGDATDYDCINQTELKNLKDLLVSSSTDSTTT